MKLTLINEVKQMAVTFYDYNDYKRLFGQINMLPSCYPANVEKTKAFKMRNANGFFRNNTVNPYTVRGVAENGVTLKATSFSSKVVSWEFDNVFVNVSGKPISPNQYLTILLLEDDDVLKLEVETTNSLGQNNLYYQYFHVTTNTDTEQQVIELESSNIGDNIYWIVDSVKDTVYFFEQEEGNSYIPKNLPQILLKEKEYPFTDEIFNSSVTQPTLTFGGSKKSGSWSSFTATNLTNGSMFTYNNVDNDEIIIVDNLNNTCVNELGVDRTANLVGSFDFTIENGNNLLQWYFNSTDYLTAQEGLPLDTFVTLDRQGRLPVIE